MIRIRILEDDIRRDKDQPTELKSRKANRAKGTNPIKYDEIWILSYRNALDCLIADSREPIYIAYYARNYLPLLLHNQLRMSFRLLLQPQKQVELLPIKLHFPHWAIGVVCLSQQWLAPWPLDSIHPHLLGTNLHPFFWTCLRKAILRIYLLMVFHTLYPRGNSILHRLRALPNRTQLCSPHINHSANLYLYEIYCGGPI